jgi:uncharacterized protein
MLVVKHDLFRVLQGGLAAMGRMSLTSYLSQTVICTTIFYGHGLGLFGRADRWHLLVLALIILVCQMIFSVVWLRSFRYGPMEWVWRSLSYWRRQPMRVDA